MCIIISINSLGDVGAEGVDEEWGEVFPDKGEEVACVVVFFDGVGAVVV